MAGVVFLCSQWKVVVLLIKNMFLEIEGTIRLTKWHYRVIVMVYKLHKCSTLPLSVTRRIATILAVNQVFLALRCYATRTAKKAAKNKNNKNNNKGNYCTCRKTATSVT